jgi:hypothetical protein
MGAGISLPALKDPEVTLFERAQCFGCGLLCLSSFAAAFSKSLFRLLQLCGRLLCWHPSAWRDCRYLKGAGCQKLPVLIKCVDEQ